MKGTRILLALVVTVAWVAAAQPAEATAIDLNGSFEIGVHTPDGWTANQKPATEHDWVTEEVRTGSRSIRIGHDEPSDSWWERVVQLDPDTLYWFIGWVRTDDVAEGLGANLAINGTWGHSEGLHGSNDWTQLAVIFDSGPTGEVRLGARLGFWSDPSTGIAWFDDLRIAEVDLSSQPRWSFQLLVYDEIDVVITDANGIERHVRSAIAPDRVATAIDTVEAFTEVDIPALSSGNQNPLPLIVTDPGTLTTLSSTGSDGSYWPAPGDTAGDRDPSADSVIVVWNPLAVDVDTGETVLLNGNGGLTASRGIEQTYSTAIIDTVTVLPHRNVLKHEFGHSLLWYFEAAETAPKPPVTNHPGSAGVTYVHCGTGEAYVWEDETLDNPIPNSIYNNESGFTHDYYSGTTALDTDPNTCLGITPEAWATGGPTTNPSVPPPPGPTCGGRTATIVGTAGDDELFGTPGNDVIVGKGGNDVIKGRMGDDLICGGAGDDTIDGGGGRDDLRGGDGNDLVMGRRGGDRLDGGDGHDELIGGRANDLLIGGSGDDIMTGGPDKDTASFASAQASVTVDLKSGTVSGQGSDTLTATENVIGTKWNDTLEGNSQANKIEGRGGDDTILGRAGDDILIGHSGHDILIGGTGDDTLKGGPGTDSCLTGETLLKCE